MNLKRQCSLGISFLLGLSAMGLSSAALAQPFSPGPSDRFTSNPAACLYFSEGYRGEEFSKRYAKALTNAVNDPVYKGERALALKTIGAKCKQHDLGSAGKTK